MTHGHGTTLLGLGSTLGHGFILVWEQSTVFHSLTNRCVVHDDEDGIELEMKEGKMMKKNKSDDMKEGRERERERKLKLSPMSLRTDLERTDRHRGVFDTQMDRLHQTNRSTCKAISANLKSLAGVHDSRDTIE
jgi:hypothetical protein